MLLQITADHFCAGLVVRDGKVVEAAPILKWTIGKTEVVIRDYCHRKQWVITEIPTNG